MSKFMWRQYRKQVLVGSAVAVGFCLLFFVMGVHMRHLLHTAQHVCIPTGSCDEVEGGLYSGTLYSVLSDLANLSVAVPIIVGLFCGVTLFGKELEDGTHKLAWTQSVTRARWIAVKVFWALLFTVIISSAWVAVVNYWAEPLQELGNPRFRGIEFDTRGIVPIAFSVFATSLGILFGVLWRRVLPAVASLLGSFLVIRLLIELSVRSHYEKAITQSLPLAADQPQQINGWVLSQNIVDPTGTPLHLLSPDTVFQMCGQPTMQADKEGFLAQCLSQHGYQRVITWQPNNRYWTFQGIEFGIFFALSALIVTYTCWRLTKTDA